MAFRLLGIARSRWKNQRRSGVPIPALGENGADASEIQNGGSFLTTKNWGNILDAVGGEITPWWASLIGPTDVLAEATALDFTEYGSAVSISFYDENYYGPATIVYSKNGGATTTYLTGSFTLQPADTLRIGLILPGTPIGGEGILHVNVNGTERGVIEYLYYEP